MPRDAPALNKKSTGSGPPWGQVWLKFKERQANTGNVAHVPKYICFYVKSNAFVMTESDSFTIENLTMYFLLKLIGVDLLAFWNVFAATCFSFFLHLIISPLLALRNFLRFWSWTIKYAATGASGVDFPMDFDSYDDDGSSLVCRYMKHFPGLKLRIL